MQGTYGSAYLVSLVRDPSQLFCLKKVKIDEGNGMLGSATLLQQARFECLPLPCAMPHLSCCPSLAARHPCLHAMLLCLCVPCPPSFCPALPSDAEDERQQAEGEVTILTKLNHPLVLRCVAGSGGLVGQLHMRARAGPRDTRCPGSTQTSTYH